jgi:hypothetical protein
MATYFSLRHHHQAVITKIIQRRCNAIQIRLHHTTYKVYIKLYTKIGFRILRLINM